MIVNEHCLLLVQGNAMFLTNLEAAAIVAFIKLVNGIH